MNPIRLMISTLALVTLAGCPTDADDPALASSVHWDLEGLEPLGGDQVYEGWVIVDGAPVSTGRFDVDADGVPAIDSFELTADQAAGAEAFVLSIEPSTGDDPAPAPTKILGADLAADGSGTLTIAHGAALGDDLSSAAASFILETPTSAAPEDYANGIWWLDPAAGAATADLPALPEGWVYEGWVVVGGPISTGRFSDPAAADSDGAGPDAGPDGAPPFPGQDFVSPAVDLVGATVVISIEPEPDNSPAPFSLKPLVLASVTDVGGGVLVDMDNQTATNNPSGSVWFE